MLYLKTNTKKTKIEENFFNLIIFTKSLLQILYVTLKL